MPLFREFSPEVRRVLQVDVVAALLLTGFSSLTGPFTGLILRTELGASPFQLSVMASANAAFMLSSLLWARMVEGRSPLPWVVWAGFVGRGLFLLVPFVHSAWQLVAVLVAANLLGTIAAPAGAMLVERMYPREQRGRALGLVRSAGALPGIVLAVGGGKLLGVVPYQWAFALAAVLGMSASLQLSRVPLPVRAEPRRPARPALSAAWADLRDDADFRRLMLAACVFGTAIWIQMPARPVLMADVLKVTTAQAGMFAAGAAVAGLAGHAVWGRLADRWGSLPALRLVYCVGAVTPIVEFFATRPGVLAVTAVTESLMTTGLDLLMTLALIEVAGRRSTARFAAVAATLGGLRGVLAPLAGAALIEHAGVRAVSVVAAALMVAGAALLTWQVRSTSGGASGRSLQQQSCAGRACARAAGRARQGRGL
ncbi:MAG TPA: MFS transporter [Methylomirabilota bacterium]|nr:MFS transporter [Methylomirabilota bacterium]